MGVPLMTTATGLFEVHVDELAGVGVTALVQLAVMPVEPLLAAAVPVEPVPPSAPPWATCGAHP